MSLTDLKNKKPLKKKKQVSVEDFIEGATEYGRGGIESYNRQKVKSVRKYKNATFTLSPKQTQSLTELSEKTGLAKSKLIRLLIDDLANEEHINLEQIKKLASLPDEDE